MNIFLTGGTGFIGSYVTKKLSDAGHTITILARNPEKVPELRHLAGVTIIPGLLSDFDVIDNQIKGKDACIHIALGWGDLATSMLKNDTFPSVFLFETAARHGISHFIYTSSTAAVGNTPSEPGKSPPPHPTDYYGATKSSSEQFLYAMSFQFPMRCNIIRPGYTFGNPVIPGASIEPDNRFKNIIKQVKAGESIEIVLNDGTQFIWAGDLAAVYERVLESEANRRCYFGLGTNFITWEKIAQKAIQITGSKSTIKLVHRGYPEEPSLFDVSLIKKDFGFEFENWQKITDHITYLIEATD